MNLDYHINKLDINKNILSLIVEKKTLNIAEFICYMQFEYFCSFFVSVLNDLMENSYKDIQFPLFSSKNFNDPFNIIILFKEENKDHNINPKIKLMLREKYVNIFNDPNNTEIIFIPNRKKNIYNLKELLNMENKIFFQKILKSIFDKLFLILHNNINITYQLFYKHNLLFCFILKQVP